MMEFIVPLIVCVIVAIVTGLLAYCYGWDRGYGEGTEYGVKLNRLAAQSRGVGKFTVDMNGQMVFDFVQPCENCDLRRIG